jgi:hypothetical protein
LRPSHICLAGLALLLAACSSAPKAPPRWSSEKEPPRDENFHGGPNATLLQYDANHDGTLTRAELIAGLKADFGRLDTNHTGCLTPDQVAAINAQRIAADQSTATPLQDWNQDGCVDLREFSTAAYSLFDQMDLNGDGKIGPQEFDPKKKAGAAPAQPEARGRRGDGGPPP